MPSSRRRKGKVEAPHQRPQGARRDYLQPPRDPPRPPASPRPRVPASLRNIPTKHNVIIRLWSFAFHKLLESPRRASCTSPLALEHLQNFIYAYTFYTDLLEEPTFNPFKSGWLEALGDLARYKMVVAAMVVGSSDLSVALTLDAISAVADPGAADLLAVPAVPAPKSVSEAPAARIDDSPSPSIGPRHREHDDSAPLHDVARFVLPMWSAVAQARCALPEAHLVDLFVLLHGMLLFTNIQLDDSAPTLARFIGGG
ncbi:hypothetical protein B0H11DRAFT_1770381 [Mycena galericulata]|nr:hypothetical protein B0H11DRAFT_1770381 [Mycena galericulata]